MLDSTTRKNIDDCRDILVGKVPDPRSQIDQITVALIYKFMHDMDQQAVELGGKPTFFAKHTEKVNGKDEVKDFAQYAWPRLMAKELGGEERVRLYAEALEKMPENPGLPPLFRAIFKQTFLPYRDPATLREFLKGIDKFTYDHSEKLGDAFEYLLSIMGSQGDAGQFRTPRHLIDFMAAVIDPQKHETILDPACGTAGFLISAYKHIVAGGSAVVGSQLAGGAQQANGIGKRPVLTPDDRKRLVGNIVGYDIDPGMVKLALVNLYLHGFPDPHIHEYDTLTSTDRWEERFDVILANPPFMSPKGGIRPHGKFGIPSTRSEVLFVDYIAEHLHPNGRALVVVPEGIIFQSGKAYKALRKKLVDEHYLVGVVSLPGGVFNPYSGVKTSLLWFDRALARKTDQLLFVKVEADGFDLGAQRRPIAQNDLPAAYALMMDYKRALKEGVKWEAPEGWETKAVVVEREVIAKNGEHSLSGDRYQTNQKVSDEFPMVPLGKLVDVLDKLRRPITKADRVEGTYPYYGATGILDHVHEFIFDEQLVLLGEDGAKWEANERSAYIATGKYWVNNHAHVIRPKRDRLMDSYLVEVLNQMDLSEYITGITVPKLTQGKMLEIQIPLPPLSEQEALVAEVEGYQRVIDGARQVVAHYKPRITIDPQWEMVELGEVTSYVGSGVTPKGGSDVYLKEGVLFIRSQNVLWGECDLSDAVFVSPEMHAEMERTHLKKDDVLLNITGASIGRCAMYLLDDEANVNQHVAIIRVTKKAIPAYVMHALLGEDAQRQIWSQQSGGTRQALNYPQIRGLKIPLPPLAEQQRIIAELEEERRMVEAAKTLAERMEARVKERVERVWGGGSDDQTIRRSDDLKNGSEPKPVSPPYPDRDEEVSMAAEPSPVAERRGPGRPPKHAPATGQGSAAAAIHNWLQAHPGLHARSAILAGTGVAATAWNAAIKQLLEAGQVERQGEKKGARYGFVRDL